MELEGFEPVADRFFVGWTCSLVRGFHYGRGTVRGDLHCGKSRRFWVKGSVGSRWQLGMTNQYLR